MDTLLVIDQSTQSTKAFIFDNKGKIISRASLEHEQKISKEGWISHDSEEIFRNVISAAKTALEKSGVDRKSVRGIGISSQRETALVWDKNGKPVSDAVVWQCVRGTAICEKLSGSAKDIRAKTGLRLSPYFSAAKIAWILENTGQRGNKKLYAGTIDSYLVYKLTREHKTDFSNASRTQLFNIKELVWDKEICGLFGIEIETLPQVCDSNGGFGVTDFCGLLPQKVPICAVMGDSHAALFGHGCLEKGMAKATYGTGSSVMVNIGRAPFFCENTVTSIAWGMNGNVDYVLEGNINYTGAAIKWLCRLGLISQSKEAGILAASASQDDATYLVPAFSGLGAPYWESGAKAAFLGMTMTTGKAEMVKAAEESIAYQIADVVKSVEEESGNKLKKLYAGGGPVRDSYLMQFQSDILGIPLLAGEEEELSATGTAYMAGIKLGIYDEVLPLSAKHALYLPQMSAPERSRRYNGWKEAVKTVINNIYPKTL